MVTGLRSAPQADIGVVMETRVGARPHIPGWDYADPYDDPYAPAFLDFYGVAAGFPRDDYPDLRPARTRDDLTHQEWPRLEATVREHEMWPYIRGHCPDGQLSAEGIAGHSRMAWTARNITANW
jgi:hypothetical protein